MKRKFTTTCLVAAGAVLVLACGHPGKTAGDGTAPKHHAPRPDATHQWVTPAPAPHPGMQTAQQPAPRR